MEQHEENDVEERERARWDKAVTKFNIWFSEGFEDGKRALESGEGKQDGADDDLELIVERTDVEDDLADCYEAAFRDLGYRAAVARRRRGTARLIDRDARPNSGHVFDHDQLRWYVLLDASGHELGNG